MPMVNIQVTRESPTPGAKSVTAEEKAKLIAGVSQLLLDNWGWGGLPTPELRRRRAEAQQKS
jgi:4-oxalocrotonate tautomerase